MRCRSYGAGRYLLRRGDKDLAPPEPVFSRTNGADKPSFWGVAPLLSAICYLLFFY
jgi:hypothetical protein